MLLFDTIVDYEKDIYRNIASIKKSQDLFDDLSDDPRDWEAANTLDASTHPQLTRNAIVQRGFDYSRNDFIEYPFEHISVSRFSDSSFPCWYGSETLETSIYETTHHVVSYIKDSAEAFFGTPVVTVERKVGIVNCSGLAIDLSGKTKEFPWLVDKNNYTKCQEVGRRVSKEGHPLIRVRSARHDQGINMVAFKNDVLSNARECCFLEYKIDTMKFSVDVFRNDEKLKFTGKRHLKSV